jgi:serine/threonine-protein kinase
MSDDPRVEELLEELLDSDGIPEEVCRACPELLPQVRAGWQRLRALKAEVGAWFPPSADSDGTTPPPLPITDLPRVRGYEVQEVLGCGGIGVVYKAWHSRLNRAVALKMLLAGPYARPEELERFLREAEAVAGLRHANVVQVYDVGDLDGRPYFTMEYVEGGSLAQKIAGTPQSPVHAAALVATLAEAIQVAHQSGIVHRDLKPGNILLTADGRPKISDFGLARRLEGAAGLTQSGAPVGTPSYMAPEQAEGKSRDVGPAADTYALGAILYELLTGRPPFRAETAAETLRQVVSQDPVPPSRLNAAVPRDLETICLKCLHKEPPRRYASAAALAEDLQRYGRGEPIAARPAGRPERLARWVRRHPGACGLLAALAVLVAATGTGVLLVYQQQLAARARQAQIDQEVRGVVARARGLLKEGWQAADLAKLTEARAEGNRAEGMAHSGRASAAVRQEANAVQEEAAERLGRAEKNRALLEAVLDVSAPQETWTPMSNQASQMLVVAQPNAEEQYAAAFRRWGLDVDSAGEDEVVKRLGAEPGPVVQELIAALDGWMMERRQRKRPEMAWRRLFHMADRLDPSERHRQLRALLVGESPPRAASAALVGVGSPWLALWELARGNAWRHLREVQQGIDPRTAPALTVVLLAQAYAAVGDTTEAEKLLRRATTARPDQVVLLGVLGKLLERQGPSRLAEAIEYFRAARSQRRDLGLALSKALVFAGRAAEAEEVLRELVPQQSSNPAYYLHRGVAAYYQKKYREAESFFGKAIDLSPDYAKAYINLGGALNAQQRYGEAETACRKAIELEPNYAEAYCTFGAALNAQQRYGKAEAACRKAIALKPEFAEAYTNLGNALSGQRKHSEAEAALRQAVNLKPDLAEAHTDLGILLSAQGKHREAGAAHRRAIALRPDFAWTYSNFGAAMNAQQKYAEAEAACRKAIELNPGLSEAYFNLGNALAGQGKYVEAEPAFRKAIELKPEFAEAYSNLGNALAGQGKYVEAEPAFRKAIALKPGYADGHYNLGNVLIRQQRYGEAEAAFRKAIALKPDFAQAHTNLGNALVPQGKHYDAEVAYRKAIALKPDLPEPYCSLSVPLMEMEKYAEAEAVSRKAIEHKPDFAVAYYNLGNALMNQEQLIKAEAAYRKAIDLNPGHASAYHNLGIVLMQQSQFDKAALASKKAGELFPAKDPHRETARRLQESCLRYAALDTRLPGILRGTEKPASATEQLDLAQLCLFKKHYATAARFARDAFTAEPKRAQAVLDGARYNAACAAALAGCGQGKDTRSLDDKERALWRRQALDWLRQDLTWWSEALDSADAPTNARARQQLRHWKADGDLAGVRAQDALARLPDDERKQWQRFWSDVDALLRRGSQPE